jgi:hypothetical protein
LHPFEKPFPPTRANCALRRFGRVERLIFENLGKDLAHERHLCGAKMEGT